MSHWCLFSGKKCTYGIKCKFHHPGRAKQSNLALADELREGASQKPASASSNPGPGLNLEDMARNLTLGVQSDPLQRNEPASQVKAGHRSSKKASLRKEKAGNHSDRSSVRCSSSQDQLDSGLGSIESQPLEPAWSLCDQQYGASYGRCNCVQQQQCPPESTPCSCCSYGPPFWAIIPPFQTHSIGPMSSYGADVGPYGLPRYPSCCTYPASSPAYSQPADIQHSSTHPCHQHRYWSDPFPARPLVPHGLHGERSHWEAPQGTSPSRAERHAVRKKLLAIFSAQLVDTAMDMFPQLLDPQRLVAEILLLQSQNQK